MNSLIDEVDPDEPRSGTDLTLGIGSLLSIFFGVVLICGIFFGFGYSMGRRNAHVPAALTALTSSSSSTPATKSDSSSAESDSVITHEEGEDNGARPAEPPPATSQAANTTPAAAAPATPEPKVAAPATPAPVHEARAEAPAPAHPSAEPKPTEAKPARVVEPLASNPALTAVPYAHRPTLPAKPHPGFATIPDVNAAPQPEPTPGHPVMVQIAAVSREEDAQTLAGALRKRGFSPSVRPGTTDKFFHVQVGPFTSKADAESMKQHLLADGYNAILK